jgi:hypothetical protein
VHDFLWSDKRLITDNKVNFDNLSQFLDLLEPHLKLRSLSQEFIAFDESSVRRYVDAQLVLRIEGQIDLLLSQFDADLKNDQVLSEMADRLTDQIKRALYLLKSVEQAEAIYDLSYLSLPSLKEHEQNDIHGAFAHMIALLIRAATARVRLETDRALILFSAWRYIEYPTFIRLLLHVATEFDSVDVDLGVEQLMRANSIYLWTTPTRRECLRFLRKKGAQISEPAVILLLEQIRSGPPRTLFNSEAPKESLESYMSQEKFHRLAKLRESGCKIDLTQAELEGVAALNLYDNRQEEFVVWHEPLQLQKAISATGIPPNELIKLLKENNFEGVDALNEWRYAVEKKPGWARKQLLQYAKDGSWQSSLWSQAFVALMRKRIDSKLPKTLCGFFQILLDYKPGPALVGEFSWAAADSMRSILSNLPSPEPKSFWDVWNLLWVGAESVPEHEDQDAVNMALNHPCGRLVEVVFERLGKRSLKRNSGLPIEVLSCIQTVVSSPRNAGRVMLASRLHYLFWIDPNWTKQYLLPHFSWNSDGATSHWQAYLWSSKYWDELLSEIKSSLIEGLNKENALGREKYERLVQLLVNTLVTLPTQYAEQDFVLITANSSVSMLIAMANSFAEILSYTQGDKTKIWREVVSTTLLKLWPRMDNLNTAETSKALARMILQADKSFPEAVDSISALIKKSENCGDIVVKIQNSKLPAEYPEAIVTLLYLLLADSESNRAYGALKEILERFNTVDLNNENLAKLRHLRNIC